MVGGSKKEAQGSGFGFMKNFDSDRTAEEKGGRLLLGVDDDGLFCPDFGHRRPLFFIGDLGLGTRMVLENLVYDVLKNNFVFMKIDGVNTLNLCMVRTLGKSTMSTFP